MAVTALRGITRVIHNVCVSGRLDLRWAEKELRCPSITHGPRGSQLSFALSPISDAAYDDLSAAQRYHIPVRLVSLHRPLELAIARVERVGEEARITGWILPSM